MSTSGGARWSLKEDEARADGQSSWVLHSGLLFFEGFRTQLSTGAGKRREA